MIKISTAVIMSLAFFAFGIYAGHLISSSFTLGIEQNPMIPKTSLQEQAKEEEQAERQKQNQLQQASRSADQPSGVDAVVAPGAQDAMGLSILKKELRDNPEKVEAWTRLGNWYFDHGQPAEAVAAYEFSLKLRPDDPNVITDQGIMYRSLGQYEKALTAFRLASKIAPWHNPALFNTGVVLLDLKRRQEALETWKTLQARDPKFITPQGKSITETITSMEQE
jgi:tetratricopeptide (TPR) repeat protein